jgi:hypothetical protein
MGVYVVQKLFVGPVVSDPAIKERLGIGVELGSSWEGLLERVGKDEVLPLSLPLELGLADKLPLSLLGTTELVGKVGAEEREGVGDEKGLREAKGEKVVPPSPPSILPRGVLDPPLEVPLMEGEETGVVLPPPFPPFGPRGVGVWTKGEKERMGLAVSLIIPSDTVGSEVGLD